jgi:hypothetical protein
MRPASFKMISLEAVSIEVICCELGRQEGISSRELADKEAGRGRRGGPKRGGAAGRVVCAQLVIYANFFGVSEKGWGAATPGVSGVWGARG